MAARNMEAVGNNSHVETRMEIRTTRKGKPLLRLDGYDYVHDSIKNYVYWKCVYKALMKCQGRARTINLKDGMPGLASETCEHNHGPKRNTTRASVKHTMTAAGPQLLQYDGFSYKWSKEEDSYEYWSCVQIGCTGSVMNRTDTPSDVRLNSKHDHSSSQPMCSGCEQNQKCRPCIVQVGTTSKCHIADCQKYLHSSCGVPLSGLSEPHRDRYKKMISGLSSTPSVDDNPQEMLHSEDEPIHSTPTSSDDDNPQQMLHSEDEPIPSTSRPSSALSGDGNPQLHHLEDELMPSPSRLSSTPSIDDNPQEILYSEDEPIPSTSNADATGPKKGPKRRLTRSTTPLGQRDRGTEADEEAEPESEAEEVQEEHEVQREGQNMQQLIVEPRMKAKEKRKKELHDLSMKKMKIEIHLNRLIMAKIRKKMTLMKEQSERDKANCERDEAFHQVRINNMKKEFELTVKKMQIETTLIEKQKTREDERKKREENLHDVNMEISKMTLDKVKMEMAHINNMENRAEGKRKREIESHEREGEMYKMLKCRESENR